MKKWKYDWFLLGMVGAVGLACLVPGPGAEGGFLHPELLTKGGVALIFFLHGLLLSFDSLKAGTLRWPLHLMVQSCTFLLFPILGIALLWLAGHWITPDLGVGFFYLCALPSTVSSSVAMTAAARGNVPVALFNATLSSLLGVLLTPLWIGTMVKTGGNAFPLSKVILDLCIWLVLPLVAGQLCRPWLGAWATRHKSRVNIVDRGTILVLVYTSFCDSVKQGVWTGHGTETVMAAAIGVAILFTIMLLGTIRTCDALRLAPADRSAVVFCGSKKTLASGIPMAQLMFGTHPGLSLILLPIMIYHPLQIVVCGVLAGRWARRSDVAEIPLA